MCCIVAARSGKPKLNYCSHTTAPLNSLPVRLEALRASRSGQALSPALSLPNGPSTTLGVNLWTQCRRLAVSLSNWSTLSES